MMSNQIIDIILEITDEIKDFEKRSFNLILDIKDDFNNKYEEERKKLPYNINLLDEIRVNENAHSRILVKLLQFQKNGDLIILKSFLKYLEEPFSDLLISNPEITAEKNRIDARIRENDFTIIIENKISGAIDQDKQIERYIDVEKEAGYMDKQIYILYLTSSGGSPKKTSISLKKRGEFGNRFKEISYRYQVLSWLNEFKAENESIFKTDYLLKSAILQYKDYLDGKFNKRIGEKNMTNEMIKLVKDKLKLGLVEDSTKIDKINDTISYTEKLHEYLVNYREELLFSVLDKFAKDICNQKITGIKEIIQNEKKFGQQYSGIIFKPVNWNERFSIQLFFEEELSKLFYGISDSKQKPSKELRNELKKSVGLGDDPTDSWPFAIYVIEGEISEKMSEQISEDLLIKQLIKVIPEIIEKTKDIKELQ